MNIDMIIQATNAQARQDKEAQGLLTLAGLYRLLSKFPKHVSCKYDTGENLGRHPSTIGERARPSCYRGYYEDCTFNASPSFIKPRFKKFLS